jgi:S-adenosylmethionine hydrolase
MERKASEILKRPIITLLTDFGLRDPYVACMKGVILSICPEAIIVDLSHEVPKFNIAHAGFLLAQAAGFFPEGTIHVAVVDPGVGTERLAIAVSTRRGVLLGPDNGVLDLAARNLGLKEIYAIKNASYFSKRQAPTFAGRDVFAPVAAHIAKGVPLEKLGPRLKGLRELELPKASITSDRISGSVIYIDSFGNLITNIPGKALDGRISIGQRILSRIGSIEDTLTYTRSYGFVKRGEPLILIGSAGFLEVAINQGNASERFKASYGTIVEFLLKG